MSNALAMIPFAEDQIDLIHRLLADATAEQRQWLSGYIAGFQAAANGPVALPAAPPAAKAPLTILYATESGNAEALAATARKSAMRMGFAAKAVDMADTSPDQLARAGNLLVIASTWGEGDPPQRAEAFLAALHADDAPRLPDLRFAVLSLGDRAYARFCETGRQIDARLEVLGARRTAARIDCDLDYQKPALAWIESTLRDIAPPQEPGGAVIHVDFMRPAADDHTRAFDAEIAAKINLNSSRSDVETYHVELSLAGSGLTYEPGDSLGFVPRNDPALVEDVLRAAGLSGNAALHTALTERFDVTTLTRIQVADYAALTGDAALLSLATDEARMAEFLTNRQLIDLLQAAPHALTSEQLSGLLRPLPPRLYSVASSQAAVGEEAHLLIGAVRWSSHGRARHGVASIDVAERRGAGATLPVYVKPNPHFRLPADPATPILMIGPGTGVAPFRAFLQHREAVGARGASWLFFGARRFTHDFLYQLEWQDWLKSGLLSRIDVAFSRDQRQKIYVQHRLWDARRDVFRWLEDGAHVYVCGDAKAMAKDVHDALLRIIADQSGKDEDGAAAYLRDVQRAGRYLRDVY